MKVIFCDIDGTLANDTRRRDNLPVEQSSNPEDYDAYHLGLGYDQPYHAVFDFVKDYMNKGWNLVFLTARPERYRDITARWINDSFQFNSAKLLMRENGDNRGSAELKYGKIGRYFLNNYVEDFILIDDRADVLNYVSERVSNGSYYLANEGKVSRYHPAIGEPCSGVEAILQKAQEVFKERNAVYGNNWERAGEVMEALFGDKPPISSYEKWDIMQQIISKLTRFANSNMTHRDSIDDLIVYAAIMANIMEKEQ